MPFAFASLPVENSLSGFSTGLLYSYIAFNRTRSPQELDKVILGVLEFYMGPHAHQALSDYPGTTRLTSDLGCGLQIIADTICMLETLFGVKFEAADISHIQTLDDLRQLVAHRVFAAA